MTDALAPFVQLYRINSLRALAFGSFGALAVIAPRSDTPLLSLVLETAGTVAVFLAIAGRAWSLLYIGGRKNAELVTDGPYSTTRNPLYLFSLIGIVGVSAQAGSLVMSITITVVAYLAFAMAMRGEEAYLARRYGERFERYRRATPRLLPKLSLWREADRTLLRSSLAVRSLRDGLVFVGAWLVVGLLPNAQSAHLLPVLWMPPF